MRYIDSTIRQVDQTVGWWMQKIAADGLCEFRCQSGYFTSDGAGVLLPALKDWSDQGRSIKLVLGSNGASTLASHVSFLAGSLGIPQNHIALGIVSFESSLFHPKVYHFIREDGSEVAYVGSANFTGSGVSGHNIEAGMILDTRDGDNPDVLLEIRNRIDSWFLDESGALSVINSSDDVERLLDEGYLSVRPIRPPAEAGLEDEFPDASGPTRVNLTPLLKLPGKKAKGKATSGTVSAAIHGGGEATLTDSFLRHTEASYHYPQGTHLGHILAILWRFSFDRQGTPFDDEFIRLSGSLGQGRLGAYRRQIKYKVLAAIELGLLNDIRYIDDSKAYHPGLTAAGAQLWALLQPHIDTATLEMNANEEYSTTLPERPSQYNIVIQKACDADDKLRQLLYSTVLAMPAVSQMLELLKQFPDDRIAKNDIYKVFFSFQPVVEFCNEVGIEPGTEESARHRCPFLLNMLESVGEIKQSASYVTRR